MKYQPIITGEGKTFTDASQANTSSAPDAKIHEEDVTIEVPDGAADAALFHPQGNGQWPGVLIWPDIMGLRPVFRQLARRLASSGFVALVPNLYHRVRPAPVVDASFSFANPAHREAIFDLRKTLTDEQVERDSVAYIEFLREKRFTAPGRVGVMGYCLGGGFAFRSAAAMPDHVAAVASFHGSDLATDSATSPHRLVAATTANYLIEIAQNDDAANPGAKLNLAQAFADAGISARLDVCEANHGWCVAGSAAYDEAEADRAWSRLIALLRHTFG